MSDVNQISISADGQDITITIGDYSDSDARTAISVSDAGGDGSVAYNNSTGVLTYTGPSASEVRAHFSAGSGISIASGVITNSRADTNTTYSVSAVDGTAGKKIIRLTGSDAATDDVTLVQGSNVTLTRAGDEITIAATDTDTNTTYGISAETASGGANLRLTDSVAGTDDVKFNSGTGITVSRTDANTVDIASTITQYTDALARATNSAANSGTGHGTLSYDNATGIITFDKVTGANIRTEVVDGRNLTYTTSTLDLDKALTSVNSVTAESATNLTLVGKQLQLNTVDVTTGGQFLNLNSTGYTYDVPLTTGSVSIKAFATTLGTTSATLKRYTVIGNVTAGSNLITNAVLLTDIVAFGGTVVDWTTVTDFLTLPVTHGTLGYFQLGVAAQSVGSIAGTYNSVYATNTQTATITLSVRDSAIASTANNQLGTVSTVTFDFCHYIRNAGATNVILTGILSSTPGLFSSGGAAYRDASSNGFQDSGALTVDYASYDYTGTQDWQISPRRILNLQPKNVGNEQIRVPFGLGVGPGSIMTNRGMLRDTFDAVGININNNGKLIGFSGKTGLNLTQFKNNSFFLNAPGTAAERCGPNFTFNSFAGNEDTANTALYLTAGDGIGQITWFAQPNTANLVSSTFTPASITVKATETHDTSIKQGAGMYFQYTPNSMGGNSRPRTFLRAEDSTVEVLGKTTVKLGRFNSSTGTSNRELNPTVATVPLAATYWATLDDTAAKFTVPVRTTLTSANVAKGGTYTPPATAMNSIILEVTAGSGTTTIDVSNLTVAGENAVFDIMVYNNSGGTINSNALLIINSGNTALDHGASIANGARAMFEVNCVDIYANVKYAGDAV